MLKVQQSYVLTQKYCDTEAFILFIQNCPEKTLDFISPAELTHALGVLYWQEKLPFLCSKFPEKTIQIRLEFRNTPGHVLGALRMGVRHIFFQGKSIHFQKIKSLASFYKADIQKLEI